MAIKIALVGDLMLGDHPVRFGHGVQSRLQHTGLSALLRDCRPLLHQADIAIGNLECVLAESRSDPTDLITNEMRGRPADALGLRDAGFSILSVANNHVMQHGPAAFDEMNAALQAAGIEAVGVARAGGESNVVTRSIRGDQIAVIGYSMRPERYSLPSDCRYAVGERDLMLAQIRELREQFPVVVLCLHWGEEYMSDPSAGQTRLARELVDAGVTALAGHHPHVLQGMEMLRGAAVFYSLGNFLSDKWRPLERESLIASVTLDGSTVSAVAIEPYHIERSFVVAGLSGAKRAARLESWDLLCARLPQAKLGDDAEYARVTEREYFRYRMASYGYFVRNIHRYPPRTLFASLTRSVRRRLGLA